MAIQFAGSSSTGGRRRRRIVVNGEATSAESSFPEGEGAEIESELVASAAAGPWVPASELRIWLYSSFVGVLLTAVTFLMHRPIEVPEWLDRLTDHLVSGTHPKLLVCIQSAFLILSAQLGLLINWYRAQCKLDFGGRYRVWPWAVMLFGVAAFFRATETHRTVGQVAAATNWFSWRGTTTGWILPLLLVALPVSLFLDRDIRNSRSSLWTLRVSAILWLAVACLEIFQPELQSQSWFASVHLFAPLYAAATLFVGLWHHARVVAYVCPDPPELQQRNILGSLRAAAGWIFSRMTFWRRRTEAAEEEDATPKKGRKKKVESEETATKKKRKAPAKKTTTRTRKAKPAEEEVEEEETAESSAEESTEAAVESDDAETNNQDAWTDSQESWEQEHEVEEPPVPDPVISETKSKGRTIQVQKAHASSPHAPHSRRQQESWEDEYNEQQQEQEQPVARDADSSEESDDDQEQFDSGMTADQMRGLSKRQKRDLKRQLREQQRSKGR